VDAAAARLPGTAVTNKAAPSAAVTATARIRRAADRRRTVVMIEAIGYPCL
jgi:hypothetical protein